MGYVGPASAVMAAEPADEGFHHARPFRQTVGCHRRVPDAVARTPRPARPGFRGGPRCHVGAGETAGRLGPDPEDRVGRMPDQGRVRHGTTAAGLRRAERAQDRDRPAAGQGSGPEAQAGHPVPQPGRARRIGDGDRVPRVHLPEPGRAGPLRHRGRRPAGDQLQRPHLVLPHGRRGRPGARGAVRPPVPVRRRRGGRGCECLSGPQPGVLDHWAAAVGVGLHRRGGPRPGRPPPRGRGQEADVPGVLLRQLPRTGVRQPVPRPGARAGHRRRARPGGLVGYGGDQVHARRRASTRRRRRHGGARGDLPTLRPGR